jgi:hypothetical protein
MVPFRAFLSHFAHFVEEDCCFSSSSSSSSTMLLSGRSHSLLAMVVTFDGVIQKASPHSLLTAWLGYCGSKPFLLASRHSSVTGFVLSEGVLGNNAISATGTYGTWY